MAQGDYLIQNQSFPSFRSDLNSTLEAINTSNSGTSRPSSAVAGTIWLDTTNATTPTLKLYDGTDDISLATFDYSANTVNWLDSTVSADLVNDLSPQLGGMLDVNGNAIGNGTEELIKFSETASAVNEVTVTNSATGNAPEISATGNDTNIDFKLTPKGTGKLILDGLNFPTADGTTGQFLKTDGSGNLSFDDAGGANTPAFQAYKDGASQSLSDDVWTKMTLPSETYDTDSAFDSSTNYRFTPQTAGKYFFYAKTSMQVSTYNDLRNGHIKFYKNGSAVDITEVSFTPYGDTTGGTGLSPFTSAVIDMNGSTDYVEAYIKINGLNSTNQSTEYNLFGGYKLTD